MSIYNGKCVKCGNSLGTGDIDGLCSSCRTKPSRYYTESEVQAIKDAREALIKTQREKIKQLKDELGAISFELGEYQATGLKAVDVRRYHDAEKEGRLIELPCKPGSVVFGINTGKIKEHEVARFGFDGGLYFMLENTGNVRWSINRFGKTIFLDRAAAEEALEGEK
jgi:hypothetical protein